MAEMASRLFQWSLRSLLLWLLLACILPGIIGSALLFNHQYQEGLAQQEKETIRTARALILAVDNQLLRAQAIGETLATDNALAKGDFAQFHERAQKAVNTSGLVSNVVLRKKDEQLVLNALVQFGDALPTQPLREHVRQVFLTGKPSISNLYMVAQFKHPIVSVDVPVFIGGKVAYSLGISVLPEHLNNLLKAQNLPSGWVASVLDSNGFIAGRNIAAEKFVGNKATPLLMQGLLKYREASIEATTQEGTAVQAAFSRSSTTNWAVAISIPRQSLHQAMMLSLTKLVASVASLFAIGLALAWLMGGRIARSIKALMAPAMALGNGKPFQIQRVHIKEVDEVAQAMDRAARILKERTSTLKLREAEVAEAYTLLRNVIDSSPALIYLKDLAGNFILVNKTYEKLIGGDPGKVRVDSKFVTTSANKEGPSLADMKVMESGGIIQFEEDVETDEGIKHFAVSKAPLRNSEGTIIGICAAAVDITSLKVAEAKIHILVQTLERRVEQRTEELNQANAYLEETNVRLREANDQLEAFSYTVAHDLRAPLRGITGFSDAMIEDYGSLLDDTGRDYLQRIVKAAVRMERLIHDLLEFSRLARMELNLGTVNVNEVFKEVMTNLSAQIHETNTTITIAPGSPCVRANKTACVQIFQNLVSNAIKFSKANEHPDIRVWFELRHLAHDAPMFLRIWIEDKGIGIPEEQQSRIFRPFERLHGIDEYQGSGIGLAIVATAVSRMHGRCGVESDIGAGSRFWIELPSVNTGDQ